MTMAQVGGQGPDIKALLVEALARHRAGDLAAAIALYERVLARDAENFDALHLGGAALAQSGDIRRGIAFLQRACDLAPQHAAARHNLGKLLAVSGSPEAALDCQVQACRLAPGFFEAWLAQGQLLQRLGRYEEALRSVEQALALQPHSAAALFEQGLCLQQLGQADAALSSYARASEAQQGGHAAAHNNRGAILQRQGRLDGALAEFRRATEIAPGYAEAHNNNGVVLSLLHRHREALASYDRALQLRPDYPQLPGRRLHAAMQICDWADFDARCEQLCRQLAGGQPAAVPFVMLAAVDSPQAQLQAARLYASRFAQLTGLPPAVRATAPGARIRIGYFSADFHDHATAHLIAGLIERHDRGQFELHGFSFGPSSNDAMRRRLRAGFECFHEVESLTPAEIAARAQALGIDIAIDLKGYTRDSLPEIFARRAAPVQISYLGYPGSMGADFIDYLVADHTLIPDAERQHYSEKILRLPGSYQANDSERRIVEACPSRAELGLPEQAVVFCAFNALYKITPDQYARWMRILSRVPGSVLWLLQGEDSASENLRREAARHGVDPQRLVFAPHLPVASHLARQAAADLFLDCHPCNAHTTASDALWAGLPLLTLQGRSFASRVASSLLHALGMPELVCSSGEQFEAQAVALASTPARLAALRDALQQRKSRSALFDSGAIAAHLEEAYRRVHQRHRAGLQPADMDIAEIVGRAG